MDWADNCKNRRKSFKFWDLVCLILEIFTVTEIGQHYVGWCLSGWQHLEITWINVMKSSVFFPFFFFKRKSQDISHYNIFENQNITYLKTDLSKRWPFCLEQLPCDYTLYDYHLACSHMYTIKKQIKSLNTISKYAKWQALSPRRSMSCGTCTNHLPKLLCGLSCPYLTSHPMWCYKT